MIFKSLNPDFRKTYLMFDSKLALSTPHINAMFTACTRAARGLVRDFGEVEHLQVSRKGPGDFVTKSDLKAEQIIIDTLQKATPTYSMLVEEAGSFKGRDPHYRWIVDPLDGTTNFINAIPHFAISIGLEYKGKIVAAMIHDPIKDEMFYAEKGKGAFMNERRIRVSSKGDFDDSIVGVTFPRVLDDSPYDFYETLKGFEANVAAVRRFGSAVLDLAYVAAGRYEGYWSQALSPWDMAAGSLIVSEAGGLVTDLDGKPEFLDTGHILAATEPFHAKMRKLIKRK